MGRDEGEDVESLDDTLASEVRVAVGRLARRLRQERPAHELGLTRMSVLSRLHRLGPASPKELAGQEGVQPQTMTRTLAGLEDAGLVARTSHPTDGRQSIISITEAGRELLRSDRRQRDAWLARAIEKRLSPVEQDFLRASARLLSLLAEPDPSVLEDPVHPGWPSGSG
ncbi:MarR family winged helix-turn-helix transcriptional regulator [Frankia sp. R82]|uniref:MarR family winged helix-turn-helix transcriptional regulator n=1 Tax=Frankia sp. R82 TaxID=2950553 RepID=UPI002043A080|nr:MarR family transcriptional regulator [Frankia sp. R82]MCM3882914.1 MarR family transcriptional regulator [Frankia sp. R82]